MVESQTLTSKISRDLSVGWNWIGFPIRESIPLEVALESINPVENDYIKSQSESATYYNEVGWFGDLTQIDPMYGYNIKLSHAATLIETDGKGGLMIDSRDGKEYNWVKIGDQVWMQENLAWLPSVTDPLTGSNTTPLYYVYNYDGHVVSEAKGSSNYNEYGVLYNFAAAQSACPEGWHLPTEFEWTELSDFLGGELVAGGKMKETGYAHWLNPNSGADNSSGFTGLPAGDVNHNAPWLGFYYLGETAFFWSATSFDDNQGYNRVLKHFETSLISEPWGKFYGFSVRCIRN